MSERRSAAVTPLQAELWQDQTASSSVLQIVTRLKTRIDALNLDHLTKVSGKEHGKPSRGHS